MAESHATHAGQTAAQAAVSGQEPVRARVAIKICCTRPTLRRTTRIALVVGVA